MKCHGCESDIPLRNLVFCWPSRITCKECGQVHTVGKPGMTGAALVFCLVLLLPMPMILSSLIPPVVEDGLYRRSSLQSFLFLFGPFIMYLLIALPYRWILLHKMTVTARD